MPQPFALAAEARRVLCSQGGCQAPLKEAERGVQQTLL